jgi:hypothetical protein
MPAIINYSVAGYILLVGVLGERDVGLAIFAALCGEIQGA